MAEAPAAGFAPAVAGSLPSGEAAALDLYATERHQSGAPLVVCEHLPKAAGRSLRRAIELDYKGREPARLSVSAAALGAAENDSANKRTAAVARLYAELEPTARARLVCIAGTGASGVLGSLDRPARALALVREPVSRVRSCFFFAGRARGLTLGDFLRGALAGERPDRFAPAPEHFFNGQARALLASRHDVSQLAPSEGPPADADEWRRRLDAALESYEVGVVERFDDSLELFAHRLGWERLEFPRLRVNEARSADDELDPRTAELVEACNWLDGELHRRCSERLDGALAELGERRAFDRVDKHGRTRRGTAKRA